MADSKRTHRPIPVLEGTGSISPFVRMDWPPRALPTLSSVHWKLDNRKSDLWKGEEISK